MSEHTPDNFVETSSEEPGAEVSSSDTARFQAEHPAETEEVLAPTEGMPQTEHPAETGEEVLSPVGETPQAEQSIEAKAPPTPENTLPPEAQGEANGGPLGCCLGLMIGLLLSLSLAIVSRVYADPLASVLQGNYGLLGLLVRILMGILAFALAIFFGYIGWGLGKRFYREYEPPVRKRRSRVKKASSKGIV